jgi:rhamnosyltransferase subunit B
MAKIVVYSMAHRGDVFPYVPIASELARRGHDVRYVVPREFHPMFATEPFRCVHSGTDFSPVELDEHGAYLARWGMRLSGGMLLRLYFGKFTIPHLDDLFEAVDAELSDADLLFSHPAASLIGAMSCERRGVPWIVGDLFPMLIPTARNPPMGMPELGPRGNSAMWRLGQSKLTHPLTSHRGFVGFRARLGLSTDRDWNVVSARLSPHRNLGLASKRYVEPADDWPSNYTMTGFTSWNASESVELDDAVRRFLDDGPPPVVVTLGTSGASARPEFFEQVAAALDDHGARGVFLTSNATVTDRVRHRIAGHHGVWAYVPLSLLLPHTAGIVQSGAHGTNALVLEAGVPSVIMPCLFDQLWHANRQEALGTGIAVRRPRELQPAIARLLTDDALSNRAAEFGVHLAAEHGARHAVDEIERFLTSHDN